MNSIPFIPDNAPFSPEQRLWLNGYLAGLFSDASLAARAMSGLSAPPAAPAKPLVVLYGSQTGTAEGLAKKASKEAQQRGFAPKLVEMAKYETVDLAKEENVLVDHQHLRRRRSAGQCAGVLELHQQRDRAASFASSLFRARAR